MKKTTLTDSQQPRKPNEVELRQLAQFIAQQSGFSDDPIKNEAEAARIVSSAFIAVFDDYCTGGPGWFGKLMVMVWDGSPSQYEVYVWEHGKLVRQKQALE